jgi:hypothetical protein
LIPSSDTLFITGQYWACRQHTVRDTHSAGAEQQQVNLPRA